MNGEGFTEIADKLHAVVRSIFDIKKKLGGQNPDEKYTDQLFGKNNKPMKKNKALTVVRKNRNIKLTSLLKEVSLVLDDQMS